MKLVMLVGPAGSGKSSWCKQHPNINRISQDDQGKKGHMDLFNDCLASGHDIIIDRMNFDKHQRNRYIDPARKMGYEIEIIVFHVPREVCFERMMTREGHPTINGESSVINGKTRYVKEHLAGIESEVAKWQREGLQKEFKAEQANSALDTFFTKYERVEDSEADKVTRLGWDGKKPTAIVCDLDGTLCNIDHRLHYVQNEDKKKRRWDLFNKTIPDDSLNGWCLNILTQMNVEDFFHNISNQIVLCSGRVDSSRQDTSNWLKKYAVPYQHLFMRHRADFRQDAIIKEIILDFEILPRYNVMFCIDDRDQVVQMWRRRGLVCLQCAPGDF